MSNKNDELSPFKELCKFADEYKFHVEIEKPFKQMTGLILKVFNPKLEEEISMPIDSIDSLDEASSSLLNNLAKQNGSKS